MPAIGLVIPNPDLCLMFDCEVNCNIELSFQDDPSEGDFNTYLA